MRTEEVHTCSLDNLLSDPNSKVFTNNGLRDVDGYSVVDELKDIGFNIHVMYEGDEGCLATVTPRAQQMVVIQK